MARSRIVPVTNSLIRWAVDQSGLDVETLAKDLRVGESDLRQWINGDTRPTESQLKRLAAAVHRPVALFYLPYPPEEPPMASQLRRTAGSSQRSLSSDELRLTRRARRMQKLSNWILAERPDVIVELPRLLVGEDTLVSAMVLRAWTGIEVARQFEWETAKQAFDDWRLVFETRGVLVMQMQLGAELRGFALHDQLAPLIAVNTGENYQARSFTLFHELCHLSLGETSACSNAIPRGSTEFNVERWCEEVAGNALIPRTALEVVAAEIKHRGVGEIELIRGVANRFKVSLRAAAIALIRLGAIAPSVYDEVAQQARISDREKGFARGRGQKAPERRRSELGVRTLSLVFDAMKANALSERDARDYLRLDGTEIDELASQFAV